MPVSEVQLTTMWEGYRIRRNIIDLNGDNIIVSSSNRSISESCNISDSESDDSVAGECCILAVF